MPAAITITDLASFTLDQGERTFTLVLPQDVITVRDLIEQRVRAEVEAYNRERPLSFRGLIQPAAFKSGPIGLQPRRFKPLDWREQADRALQAFLGNGFLILVNDEQVTELDDRIALTADTFITFFKLVPLVGG